MGHIFLLYLHLPLLFLLDHIVCILHLNMNSGELLGAVIVEANQVPVNGVLLYMITGVGFA